MAEEPISTHWERHLGVGTTAQAFMAVAPVMVAVAFAKPWLVGLAVVPLMVLVSDIVLTSPPRLDAKFSIDNRRVMEGDVVTARLDVVSSERGSLFVTLERTGGLCGSDAVSVIDVIPGGAAELDLVSTADRWGRASLTMSAIEWRSPLGLVVWRAEAGGSETVWIHPRPMEVRSRLGISRTTIRTGPHTSRVGGEGVEFHSTRPFQPGDRGRDIDQRRLALRDEAWTRLRHVERSRDVVIVVDLLEDGRDPSAGPTLVDHALRAADGVVRVHLRDRDRVGVIVLGDQVSMVRTADGARHALRILDRLMAAKPRADGMRIGSGIDLRRRIPAGATVLMISPLYEIGLVEQLLSLRRHGRDVAVLHVGYDLIDNEREALSRPDRQAADLRRIRSEASRAQLRAHGVAVVAWSIHTPVDVAVEQILQNHRALVRRQR